MIPGSLWIEGTELHWLNASGTEYKTEGDSAGAVAGIAGSIWITGSTVSDGQIHYVDAFGDHRYTFSQPQYFATVAGVPGSIWMESAASAATQLRFVVTNGHAYYINGTVA